jgi:hypothetical protein
VQAACYQLVLDRALREYRLPDRWTVFAAGNRDGPPANALVSAEANLMLKVRTSVVNGMLDRDYAVAGRWARRPFRRSA